jgi:DNA repair exonuclease SbcCD ATPase subunit
MHPQLSYLTTSYIASRITINSGEIMPDQETLREIKRVLELTSRVDERVKMIAESHKEMADRLERFIEHHNTLAERVTKIESSTWTGDEVEERIEEVEEDQSAITLRVATVESNAPYALKIVDQSLEALNKLTDRVAKVELDQHDNTKKLKTWSDWLGWGGDFLFKLAWIVIAAYLLLRLGLGGTNIPTPF